MSAYPRSVADLIRARQQGDAPKLLLFWGHRARRDGSVGPGCLSQWWPAPFEVDGRTFATAEHYMMWRKAMLFGDADIAARILDARHPHRAKTLGRQAAGFDEAVWAAHRYGIVVAANEAKFGQHGDLRAFLLGTGDRVLVEASPVDRVWGIGLAADDPRADDPAQWRGLNLLGFALMDVRAALGRPVPADAAPGAVVPGAVVPGAVVPGDAAPVRLAPGDAVTVRLVKHPRPEVRYPAAVVSDDGSHVVVRAPWSGPPSHDMGFARFEHGDVFTEHFWRDRWYSVKEVRDRTGVLKGWYCDVTRPATVRPGMLTAHDLDLDLWVSADGGTVLRLDEDEFAASGLAERDPATAEQARRALDELASLAGDRFATILGPR